MVRSHRKSGMTSPDAHSRAVREAGPPGSVRDPDEALTRGSVFPLGKFNSPMNREAPGASMSACLGAGQQQGREGGWPHGKKLQEKGLET